MLSHSSEKVFAQKLRIFLHNIFPIVSMKYHTVTYHIGYIFMEVYRPNAE